jgi:hypothetical protein
MNLDQQLEIIIKDAPKYGVPSLVMQQAVTPILRLFAQQLQAKEYYILQTSAQELLLTTLTNIEKPNLEKKVIYAFATVENALNFESKSEQTLYPQPILVAELLFQLFALKSADSLIFVEKSGDLNKQIEVSRNTLQKSIESNLEKLVKINKNKSNNIPPNLA